MFLLFVYHKKHVIVIQMWYTTASPHWSAGGAGRIMVGHKFTNITAPGLMKLLAFQKVILFFARK